MPRSKRSVVSALPLCALVVAVTGLVGEQVRAGSVLDTGTLVVSGATPGTGGGEARIYSADARLLATLQPYGRSYTGGVRVAIGDVTGNGTPDLLLARGPRSTPIVSFLSGNNLLPPREGRTSATAFSGEIRSGIHVAAGDVNGDGRAEVIAGTAGGSEALFTVVDSATSEALVEEPAYGRAVRGGVFVAAGDLDGDGKAEIVTGPAAGGGPKVKVFDGATGIEITSFDAYAASFRGGVRVAVGDVNGDGVAEIITAPGAGRRSQIRIFSDPTPRTEGLTFAPTASFLAYDPAFRGGVNVAAGNLDADPEWEIATVPIGTQAKVRIFNPDGTLIKEFLGLDRRFKGEATLAVYP